MFIKLSDGSLLNLDYVVSMSIEDDKQGKKKIVMEVDKAKTKKMDLLGELSPEQAEYVLDCLYEIDLDAIIP